MHIRQIESPQDFEKAIADGLCLLDFKAPWCGAFKEVNRFVGLQPGGRRRCHQQGPGSFIIAAHSRGECRKTYNNRKAAG